MSILYNFSIEPININYMENIFAPDENFKFDNITLGQPNAIQGGAYFTKILCNNKSLYIQCPKCVSKQGIIKNGKKCISICCLIIATNRLSNGLSI